VVAHAERKEIEAQPTLDLDGFEDYAEPAGRLGKVDLQALR
jgi:hypothetical protein